jgi:hypothetical protein
VWISEGPAHRCELRPNPRYVLISRELIGDTHDEFADIDIGDRQRAFVPEVGGHHSDFFSGEPTGEKREQGDIVLLRNPLRIASPQPLDNRAQEWWQ